MTVAELITATVGGVSGLSGKVYPHTALKNAKAPFVFYLLEKEEEPEALDGGTGLYTAHYQIHVVDGSYYTVVSLANSVRAALRALQGTTTDGLLIQQAACSQVQPDQYETEVGLFRRPLYLKINYQLTA